MIIRTVCQYDCPDTCGMLAEVIDGKIVKVWGDPDHPQTKGMICRKTQSYEKMIYHPERILYPMKRTGKKGEGLFERISWEEAVDTICSRWKDIIRDYGAEAILPYSYAGTEGILQKNCGEAFFHYMGASKLKRTICSSAKGAGYSALMGDSIAMSVDLLAESDHIIIWGSNIAATRLHAIPYIKEARKKGARVTLIDVYASAAAAYCDETIVIRPGSDAALALTMIGVMEQEGLTDRAYIEEAVEGYDKLLEILPAYSPEWAEQITGIKADVIRRLALSYGRAIHPSILIGSGPSRQAYGGMLIRAITALPAVKGSWRDGFGVCGMSQSGNWGDKKKITRPDFDKTNARNINMMQLGSALDLEKTDPPVKSFYVYHCNPLAVSASQKQVLMGLMREDLFTVVHERFMTDTARYADIILPALFSPEAYDIFQPYGYNAIQYAKKALQAPGECKSNWDCFCLLAKGMGFEDPYFLHTEEEMCLSYLDHKSGQQADLDEEEWKKLMEGYAIEKKITAGKEIKTKSGKIMLYNPDCEEPLIRYLAPKKNRYPLHLVAAPSVYTLNSTFLTQDKLVEKRGKMRLRISIEDSRSRGIHNGDTVLCQNEQGEACFYAYVDPTLLSGTVVAEGVFNRAQSINGFTVNALLSEELSDMGEATTMNANYVELCRL